MTAIETIQKIMESTDTSLSELAEYGDLGTKENVYQMLKRNDLKVGTFVTMLESMGYQLLVQGTENDEETVIDYQEGEITVDKACEQLNIGKTTWYKLLKEKIFSKKIIYYLICIDTLFPLCYTNIINKQRRYTYDYK